MSHAWCECIMHRESVKCGFKGSSPCSGFGNNSNKECFFYCVHNLLCVLPPPPNPEPDHWSVIPRRHTRSPPRRVHQASFRGFGPTASFDAGGGGGGGGGRGDYGRNLSFLEKVNSRCPVLGVSALCIVKDGSSSCMLL